MRKNFNSLLLICMYIFLGSSFLTAATSNACAEIEAVIFDCDGVLVDTEYLKFLAWKEAFAEKDIQFSIEEYMPVIGHSSKNILSLINKHKGLIIDESVIKRKDGFYKALQQKGVPPLEAMITYARELSKNRKALGIKMGLASSATTSEILQNLRQIGLEDAFDLIISGHDDLDAYEDLEGKNKPKPYIYLEAAKRLNVSPAKCLVFEDTTAGIEAGYFAGMNVIAVPNQFTLQQDFSKAIVVVHDTTLLPKIEKNN